MCALQLAYISAVTCRTDAVSGPGRRRIPLSPDSLPSPATPSKLPQPPRDTRKEKISWNPFHTSDCRHYLLGCKARREVEILKIASIRFLFITLQATLFEVLSAAEWEVTSHSTAEPRHNYRIQISWFCSPASRLVQISCTHSTTDRRDLDQQCTYNYRQLGCT